MSDNIIQLAKQLQKLTKDPAEQRALLSGAGPVHLLEQRAASYYGKKHALAVSSATMAISILIEALALTKRMIVVSPFSWGGSITPFVKAKNRIVVAAADPDHYNLTEHTVREAIQDHPDAIIFATDFAGNYSNSAEIAKAAKTNNCLYIHDCSQSFGALDQSEKPSGAEADVIIISFGATKTLYGGEGGAIITDDTNLYHTLIRLSQHPDRQRRFFAEKNIMFDSLNARINPIAAILINAIWDEALIRLKEKQNSLFAVYHTLVQHGILFEKKFLEEPHHSTFWLPLFELGRNAESITKSAVTNIGNHFFYARDAKKKFFRLNNVRDNTIALFAQKSYINLNHCLSNSISTAAILKGGPS